MVLFESSQRLGIEQALPGSPAKSIAPLDGVRELKDALAEAMGKFNPDRTVLPIPDRTFGGTIGRNLEELGRRLVDDPRPAGPGGGPQRPHRPHR